MDTLFAAQSSGQLPPCSPFSPVQRQQCDITEPPSLYRAHTDARPHLVPVLPFNFRDQPASSGLPCASSARRQHAAGTENESLDATMLQHGHAQGHRPGAIYPIFSTEPILPFSPYTRYCCHNVPFAECEHAQQHADEVEARLG